jgi:hypothetical protein
MSEITEDQLDQFMLVHAAQAVEFALSNFNTELDYSSGTLILLESILDSFLEETEEAEPTDEQKIYYSTMWGAYLGETIRREIGGEWKMHEDECCVLVDEEYIPVISKVYDHISIGSEESIVDFFHSLHREHLPH